MTNEDEAYIQDRIDRAVDMAREDCAHETADLNAELDGSKAEYHGVLDELLRLRRELQATQHTLNCIQYERDEALKQVEYQADLNKRMSAAIQDLSAQVSASEQKLVLLKNFLTEAQVVLGSAKAGTQ